MIGMTRVFAALAILDRHAFAFRIDVPNIEIEAFAATNAEPPDVINSVKEGVMFFVCLTARCPI
jgi:hypothetical protein